MSLVAQAYYVVLSVSTLTSAFITYYAWKKRKKTGSLSLVALHLIVTVWCGTSLFTSLTAPYLSRETVSILVRIFDTAVVLIPVPWFLFIMDFSGREAQLTRRNIGIIAAAPIFILGFVWTNPLHHLYRESFTIVDTYYAIELTFGPFFYAAIAYGWTLILLATGMLLEMALNSQSVYRRQATALLLGSLAPWAGAMIYMFTPINGDFISVGFAIAGVVITFEILRGGYMDVLPVARDTVVDRMGSGIIVVSRDEKLIDINSSAKEMLMLDDDLIGKEIPDILSKRPQVYEIYQELTPVESEKREEVSLKTPDGEGFFQIMASPLYDNKDRLVGETFVINDITKQKEREEKLREREHELDLLKDTLSRFLRHNIRNELNLIQGYAEMLSERYSDEEIEKIIETSERLLESSDKVRYIEEVLEETEGKGRTEDMDITESIEKLAEEIDRRHPGVDIQTRLPEEAWVNATPYIDVAIENIVENAVEHNNSESPTVKM
ncbi:MAG: histidine kinase N-terminal 7TM domain-containing protein, partial [Halobacteria archaeon]|nr:histidine kinase N-terminal 7TM domain-containing protein [Halobacteria archaeon]